MILRNRFIYTSHMTSPKAGFLHLMTLLLLLFYAITVSLPEPGTLPTYCCFKRTCSHW